MATQRFRPILWGRKHLNVAQECVSEAATSLFDSTDGLEGDLWQFAMGRLRNRACEDLLDVAHGMLKAWFMASEWDQRSLCSLNACH